MEARLNFFQRTMLRWNAVHPYNAVHVVRVPAPLEAERLGRVVDGALEAHGLAGLTLNRDGTYCHHGGPVACPIKLLHGGTNPHAALCAEIETQLNTAFAAEGRFNPFKFFVLPGPDDFRLGLVYFHAIGDAEAVALLLLEMADVYLKRNWPAEFQPFVMDPPPAGGRFSRPKILMRGLAGLPGLIREMRNTGRLDHENALDFKNRFTFCTLPAGSLGTLLQTAKAWNVTLNDVFLALLMKCLAGQKPGRLSGKRRRKISIGCIVNLRKDLGLEGRRAFGLFLGSFVITHGVPGGISLLELARDIRRRTQAIRRRKLYLGTSLEMALSRFIFPWFSVERQKKLYQRHYPLWGGITNMNLNSLKEQWPGKPLEYVRGVSTGPVTPLVLSVTTAGDSINLGLSWRPSFYAEPDIARIQRLLFEELKNLNCP